MKIALIMKKTLYSLLFLLIIQTACTKKEDVFVPYSNPEIEYWGRVDSSSSEGVDLYWSGSSIKVNFEGESIQALLQDESGDNYYNVIIDKDSLVLIRPNKSKNYYQLASNLSKGKHSIEIFKRTEWDRGKTRFYGFKLEKASQIVPKSSPKKRKIEFYGNSITAGYAVEDTTGKDSPDSTYTNNYLSYAAITARHFDAEYQCNCKSGIGITISWFPLIMPQIYDRLIPNDSKSKWDFSLFNPDVVVVNLFQNDSWLVNQKDRPEYKQFIGENIPDEAFLIDAYQQFIAGLRNHYPNATIICALGNMDATKEDSKWPNYIEKAVENLNDQKIYTHFFPFKGTRGHPSISEQEEMAKSLIQFIDETIQW